MVPKVIALFLGMGMLLRTDTFGSLTLVKWGGILVCKARVAASTLKFDNLKLEMIQKAFVKNKLVLLTLASSGPDPAI